MLINCPKCGTRYDVDESTLPAGTKKLKCAECGEVFALPAGGEIPEKAIEEKAPEVAPDPEAPEVPETKEIPELKEPEPVDMQGIFDRLSMKSEQVAQEAEEIGAFGRAARGLKRALGLNKASNAALYLVLALAIAVLSAFYARYEIVRSLPAMEHFYDAFGMESVVVGEGLEFANITRDEYEEDFVKKLEIRGFIVNKTNRSIAIPKIRVEMLDEGGNTLQTVNSMAAYGEAAAGERTALKVVVSKPSAFSKYVLLTFLRE